jgi:hypothetical protein
VVTPPIGRRKGIRLTAHEELHHLLGYRDNGNKHTLALRNEPSRSPVCRSKKSCLRASPDLIRLGTRRLLKVTPRTACTGRYSVKASYHVTASLRHSHWITAPGLSGQTKGFPSTCSQSTGVPAGHTPSSPHKRSSAPADRITHNRLKNAT